MTICTSDMRMSQPVLTSRIIHSEMSLEHLLKNLSLLCQITHLIHTQTLPVSRTAWIFQTPSQDLLEESERKFDKLIKIQDYILVPFLEDDIDPYEWLHTLSTIDVCTIPPQTQFCDEYGHNIVPIRVIFVAYTRTKDHIKDLPFKISLTVIDQQCRHMVNALVDQDVRVNVLSWECGIH